MLYTILGMISSILISCPVFNYMTEPLSEQSVKHFYSDSLQLVRLSYVIGRLDRVISQHIEACVAPYDLSVTQYTTLSVLSHRSGLSNAQLARRAYVTPQAMNQVLAQLAQVGLIERESHATHGRILCVNLTEQGKTVLAVCDAAVEAMEQQMLNGMDIAGRESLRKALIGCVRALGGGLNQFAAD